MSGAIIAYMSPHQDSYFCGTWSYYFIRGLGRTEEVIRILLSLLLLFQYFMFTIEIRDAHFV